MRNKLSTHSGFTLIELLVSMVVFVIFVSVAAQGYISIMRAQHDANIVRQTYSEVRTIADTLGEQARLNTIDYGFYEDPAHSFGADGSTDVLVLKNAEGTIRTTFQFEKGNVEADTPAKLVMLKQVKKDGVWVSDIGFNQAKAMHSTAAQIDQVLFLVSPLKSPQEHLSQDVYQFQPLVTVLIDYANGQHLQASYSSRLYAEK